MPKTDDQETRTVADVETRSAADTGIHNPDAKEQLDQGPVFTAGGAVPGGSSMNHWTTAYPDTDPTKPETMPHTKSTPRPGETKNRVSV